MQAGSASEIRNFQRILARQLFLHFFFPPVLCSQNPHECQEPKSHQRLGAPAPCSALSIGAFQAGMWNFMGFTVLEEPFPPQGTSQHLSSSREAPAARDCPVETKTGPGEFPYPGKLLLNPDPLGCVPSGEGSVGPLQSASCSWMA